MFVNGVKFMMHLDVKFVWTYMAEYNHLGTMCIHPGGMCICPSGICNCPSGICICLSGICNCLSRKNINLGDFQIHRFYCCCTCKSVRRNTQVSKCSDLILTLMNAFSIFISNRDVMYLSDIKSYVTV